MALLLRMCLMDHKLRPILRLDADLRSAVIELRGCLTVPATIVLRRLLLSCRALKDQLALTLDLRAARHIDPAALTALRLPPVPQAPSDAPSDAAELHTTLDQIGPLKVILPPVWPVCPVDKALGARGVQPLGQT